MKITVKIATIEVTVDRPNFKEANTVGQDEPVMKTVIIPTLHEAVQKAKELYNIKKDNL